MRLRAVFLVGFMACGKTTTGAALAQRLGWDFVDLDALIEARERRTVSEIFDERGETGFRLAETNALRELTKTLERDAHGRPTVVALGGGTFAQATNRALLRGWPSVFLEAPLDELWQRTQEHPVKRPLRKDRAEFSKLYQARLPFYRQSSVTVVTSGNDQGSLCAEIERRLLFWGKIDGVDGKRADARDLSDDHTDPSETGELQ